ELRDLPKTLAKFAQFAFFALKTPFSRKRNHSHHFLLDHYPYFILKILLLVVEFHGCALKSCQR
ncbi:MAG: hypothetical protein ACOYYJ_11620, partial [Chloroflexota bacterium]